MLATTIVVISSSIVDSCKKYNRLDRDNNMVALLLLDIVAGWLAGGKQRTARVEATMIL